LSIEVKIASGSLEEARGQLGLWIAAWHTRMSLLRKCNEEIIALPLVIVMEHEWKLMFAVDRGDSIVSGTTQVEIRGSTNNRTGYC
jgi:hypothetical protein